MVNHGSYASAFTALPPLPPKLGLTTAPPPCGAVVLWSGFGGLIERFRLSLQKLIVFMEGFYKI